MERANRNAFIVWLALVLLTLVTYAVGKLGYGGVTVVAMLLLSVSLKGQLLIDYFMGLAHVHSGWKWVVTGWLVSVVSLIGVAYWISI
jgi:cytochrome c oxidase subunit IV